MALSVLFSGGKHMGNAITITPEKATTRFVAVDGKDRSRVLAEAKTAKAVLREAEKTGRSFSVMYIPAKGETYVF